ncbi:unnamed protein product [Ectocarpus sp. CCAP 1310/34]|nr:unnamed protein product [Ectocarpus sp. CCAP 1310/34]
MEIVHCDEKEVVKLRRQLETTRGELMESGKALGNSKAIVETYRAKAETASSEFSEINNMLLREIKMLKEKLANAGPEVVAKISEERDKAESRVRSANRTVSDLESVVVELQAQVQRDADDNLKVEEMEHHLLEASKETKAMAFERESHASAADELRATVASLNTDLQQANDKNAKLLKDFEDHEENSKRSIVKDAASADGSFFADFNGKPEVVAPPSEKSDKMLVLELTEGLRRKEEELEYWRAKVEEQNEERDRAVDKELMERELDAARKQAAAARSTVEVLHTASGGIVLKGKRDNKKLLKMWNDARARLQEAEGTNRSGDGSILSLPIIVSKVATEEHAPPEEVKESAANLRSGKRARRSTRKGGRVSMRKVSNNSVDTSDSNAASSPPSPSTPSATLDSSEAVAADTADSSDEDDAEGVMAVAISYLEEDCRRLGVAKGELQGYCNNLQIQLKSVQESLAKMQSSLESERQGKEEAERGLEERRELLSKATLAVAEHSMALHDAQEGTDKVKQELEQERTATAQLGLQLKEMGTVNGVLEAGLVATKHSLEIMTTAKGEAEAAAERNASQAKHNALRAEGNASWAEAEGMRAEEESSRRFLSDVVAAERVDFIRAFLVFCTALSPGAVFVDAQIAFLGVELSKCVNELKRRRLEAKEHAEQMKEFWQVVAERARLEEEVASQRDTILDMRQRTAKDQTMIEELKLQVVLLDGMRKEVLSLEDKLERLQVELSATRTSLEASNQQRKVTEQDLRANIKLNRSLWAALTSSVFLLDDWCAGPLLAWRERDPAAEPPAMPKPPLEARAVEDIVKLRRQSPGGADATRSSLTSPPLPTEEAGVSAGAPATTMSIQDRLEGQRPRAVAAWLRFRVQIATVEHQDRVDSARSDQVLLDSVCKQRAAQISNMEEAMRRLEATRAALQKEHDELLVEKEELHETVLKQNDVLFDNSKELRKYSALKVEHAAEVRQHRKVARCLQEAEGNIRRVNIRLERAIGDAAVAASLAKEAESVRASAVEERKAAVVEAQTIRDTMEGERASASRGKAVA